MAAGVGGCLFIWTAHRNPAVFLYRFQSLLPPQNQMPPLLDGVSFLFFMTFAAFFSLVLYYLLARCVEELGGASVHVL
jgi:hypothetical protein